MNYEDLKREAAQHGFDLIKRGEVSEKRHCAICGNLPSEYKLQNRYFVKCNCGINSILAPSRAGAWADWNRWAEILSGEIREVIT